jgi:hypothetical protein
MKINIQGPLSNYDLQDWADILDIKLRGIYMIDTLPKRINLNEKSIINLDSIMNSGTHWVAYKKHAQKVYYFDPIGNLQPPIQLINYFKQQPNVEIYFNYDQLQTLNSNVCGHFCLLFLADAL